jgi:hypothetical protein
MTSQGSAYGRLQRALGRGDLLAAETAARELGQLTLPNALRLLVLLAAEEPVRYDRAAVRWLERLLAERPITLADVAAATEALMRLPGGAPAAGDTLAALAARQPRRPTSRRTA